ncbi:uncharacterized protein RCC_04377 [Ramularia collo-cygni]|uniref:Acyl-protein thioesterase 1 n=1 Tax=Ramularia collo-cygni TaxID=112498 RepID=A0A2D3UPM9_9PEZI|nr:uncharacterized protein RCC_04377 [Ramularia collo-cygni]CZT18532.1 uncharacterized protein RCC_04377 [Ramularia collo-cygni]
MSADFSNHPDSIQKPATEPAKDIKNSAVFIFNHGLADSAAAIENIADQFQQGNKLPYMSWVLPNAKRNPVTLDTAWFTPHGLPSHEPSRPELVPEEDEEGMIESSKYLESLIDAAVAAGTPVNRIVLGGFSQGGAMSLLTHMRSSKYSGKLAGIAALLTWLPLVDGKKRLQEIRTEAGLDTAPTTPIFLARGTKDEFVPKRAWFYSLEALLEIGVPAEALEINEYRIGHTVNGPLIRDLCAWLEKVVPALE